MEGGNCELLVTSSELWGRTGWGWGTLLSCMKACVEGLRNEGKNQLVQCKRGPEASMMMLEGGS